MAEGNYLQQNAEAEVRTRAVGGWLNFRSLITSKVKWNLTPKRWIDYEVFLKKGYKCILHVFQIPHKYYFKTLHDRSTPALGPSLTNDLQANFRLRQMCPHCTLSFYEQERWETRSSHLGPLNSSFLFFSLHLLIWIEQYVDQFAFQNMNRSVGHWEHKNKYI